jgi:hypothetical protein
MAVYMQLGFFFELPLSEDFITHESGIPTGNLAVIVP